MSKRSLPTLIVIILTIIGGLGSIITRANLTMGIILLILGICVAVYRIIVNELNTSIQNKQLEAQNILLASRGLGNVYQEIFKSEIKQKGKSPRGIELLLKAYKLQPNNVEVIENLSSFLALRMSFNQWATNSSVLKMESSRDWKFAKDIAEKGLTLKPNSHILMDTLGILNDLKGDHILARKWFLKSSIFRVDPYWRLLISTSWGLSGRDDKALEEVEQVINNGETNWFLYLHYGESLVHAGKCVDGIKYLDLARRVRGMHPVISFNRMYASTILSSFKIGLALDVVYLSMLLIYLESWHSIARVIRLDTMYLFTIFNNISKSIWRITSKIRLLRNAHYKIYSPTAFAFSAGWEKMKGGDYKSASHFFEICYSICPKAINVLANLSLCYVMVGERDKSEKFINEALEIEPHNQMLLWNKEQLKSGVKINPRFDASPKNFSKMVNKPTRR